jgi:hypothetical protein
LKHASDRSQNFLYKSKKRFCAAYCTFLAAIFNANAILHQFYALLLNGVPRPDQLSGQEA